MENKNVYFGLIYACGKGLQKECARESLIMDILYNTNDEKAIYLKLKDINVLGSCDEENESYYIYKFGYYFQIPRTEIDLFVSKKDGKIFIKKVGIGYDYGNVEKEIYKVIKEQIKTKNLYIMTNLNYEEFLIK